MKILFLSNVFPNPLNPGKGTFNQSLMAAMAEQHEVQVVAPVSWLDELTARIKTKQKIDRSITHHVSGIRTEYPRFYYPPKIMRHRFGQFMWMSIRRELQKQVKRFQPQAVLSYWAHPDGEVAINIAQQAGVPAITMVGGSDVLLLARSGKRRAAIMNVLQQSDSIISVSQDIANHLKSDGIDSNKLHVVHRGVDRELFTTNNKNDAKKELLLPTNQPILVAAGRLVNVKGHEVLISACQFLAQQGRTFQCHIVGDGPLRERLQKQIDMSNLQSIVHLRGSQTQQQLATWYQAADMMVHPSYSEGIPNVLLEAMSCGTPFVASNVGGIPEIADNNFDQLVPSKDPEQLAQAILRQLQRPAETTSNSRAFQPLSWKDSAQNVVDILQQAIQQKQNNTTSKTLNSLQGMLELAGAGLKEVSP